jgi:hypothetical protein
MQIREYLFYSFRGMMILKKKIITAAMLLFSFGLACVVVGFLFPGLRFYDTQRSALDRKISEMGRPLNPEIMAFVKENETTTFPRICDKKETAKRLGVSEDVYFLDVKLAEAGDDPCVYCIGFIFQIYMKTLNDYMMEHNIKKIGFLNKDNAKTFRRVFYGVTSKKTCVQALTEYGLGVEVPDISLAEPGDLIQFWRVGKTGHCVIFISSVKNPEGDIMGIRFWSAQGTTNGVSYKTENFIKYKGSVDPFQVYIVRLVAPY